MKWLSFGLFASLVFCSEPENVLKAALQALSDQVAQESCQELLQRTKQAFDAFGELKMSPDTDIMLMTSLDTLHAHVSQFYEVHPEFEFEEYFCTAVLSKVPEDDLEDYDEDALDILACHLFSCLDFLQANLETYEQSVVKVLQVCYNRIPKTSNGEKFCKYFDNFVEALNVDDTKALAHYVVDYVSSESMLLPQSWLNLSTPYGPVLERIYENLIWMADDFDVVDPQYFLAFYPIALKQKNVKLLGSIAELFPRFQSDAFASDKEQVLEFVFGCRSLLAAEKALPVVEYFLNSKYLVMNHAVVPLFHFTKRSVPEEFKIYLENFKTSQTTVLRVIRALSKVKSLKKSDQDLWAMRQSCETLFSVVGPKSLSRDIIEAIEEMQMNMIKVIKEIEFGNCIAVEVVAFILGFLLKAEVVSLRFEAEVAYIFVDALASRVQYFFKYQSTSPEAADIFDSFGQFEETIEAAFSKIKNHALTHPNTLSVKIIMKGFVLTEKLNLVCDNVWLDAVMLDHSSTSEMWSLVYSHMRLGYSDANLLFSSFLYWHLHQKQSETRKAFISNLIGFYETKQAISGTELDFAKLLLKANSL